MIRFLFLLLPFCATAALGQTNSEQPDSLSECDLNSLYETGDYMDKYLDLNDDGKRDLILHPYNADMKYMYIFLRDEKGVLRCSLKTSNLIMDDNGSVYSIRKEGDMFYIYFNEYNEEVDWRRYYIKYDAGQWILLSHTARYRQLDDDENRYDICTNNINKKLPLSKEELLKYTKPTSQEYNIDTQCEPDFYFEFGLNGIIKRFEKYDNEPLQSVDHVERYNQLVEEYPIDEDNIDKYYYIAYLAKRNGLYHEAECLLKHIINKFPRQAKAYYALIDVYWALDMEGEAQRFYHRYISMLKRAEQESKATP